jgi:predicted protein tyrosine phosphatase
MKVEVRNRSNLCNKNGIAGKTVAVISISDPHDNLPNLPTWPELKEVLSLAFHDIDERWFAPEVMEQYSAKALRELESYTLMSDEDGKKVAAFVDKHKDVDLLIVQCDAGISRSSGMAAAILKHLTGDDSQIFGNRRFCPNRFVNKKTREALHGWQKATD